MNSFEKEMKQINIAYTKENAQLIIELEEAKSKHRLLYIEQQQSTDERKANLLKKAEGLRKLLNFSETPTGEIERIKSDIRRCQIELTILNQNNRSALATLSSNKAAAMAKIEQQLRILKADKNEKMLEVQIRYEAWQKEQAAKAVKEAESQTK